MAPRASIAAGYFLKAQNAIGTSCFATALLPSQGRRRLQRSPSWLNSF